MTTITSFAFNDALRTRFTERLANLRHTSAPAATPMPALKAAAVTLILTGEPDGETAVVLTRRSSKLNAHPGQFAFPGGRVDAGETITQAALREAHEEVDAKLEPMMIVGQLDDYATRSGYLITPLVAWAPAPLNLTANPHEVATIYYVTLAEMEALGEPEFVAIPESEHLVIRYPMLNTKIHAPTAALLYQLMEVCVHGRMTRVAQLEQPTWAWR